MAGETYYFRVQVSTANGTLYTAELMTFTLSERNDAVADTNSFGENVAIGAPVVEVSSEFGSSWLASNAIDADNTTE